MMKKVFTVSPSLRACIQELSLTEERKGSQSIELNKTEKQV
jgi:hypothetical protein